MNRLIFFLSIGLGGAAILIYLGTWQVQRLAWKESILAQIERRIAADPVPLPASPDPEADLYLPVSATGTPSADYIRVLASQKQIGAGYRIIRALDTGTRRVLLDEGFVRTDADIPAAAAQVAVQGNLHWPDEIDGFTPDPDRAANIWFARDVLALADALNTEPLLIVARSMSPEGGPVTPLPVDTAHIPNDHLEYAITWFSLALIWLGMTAYFVLRTHRGRTGTET
ncbi:MAG: SURF1 family protein [Pseudomonadota bacterium]